jgi:hypothetical protein
MQISHTLHSIGKDNLKTDTKSFFYQGLQANQEKIGFAKETN